MVVCCYCCDSRRNRSYKMRSPFTLHIFLAVFAVITAFHTAFALEAIAVVNVGGLRGNVTFLQENTSSNVTIILQLRTTGRQNPENYKWSLAPNSVSYSEKDPCNKRLLGNRIVTKFDERHGEIEIGPDEIHLEFSDGEISLFGPTSIWDKALLFEGPKPSCANIIVTSPNSTKTIQAKFTSPIAGSILFRQVKSNYSLDTFISVDVFHVSSSTPQSSMHDWKLMATELFNSKPGSRKRGRRQTACEDLSSLYDPNNIDDKLCSKDNHKNCKIGDLIQKHGQITVGTKSSRFTRNVFYDSHLPLGNLDEPRSIYVVVFEAQQPEVVLGCAHLMDVLPKTSQAQLEAEGFRGHITFQQQSPLDPTYITINFSNLQNRGMFYHVHELPIPPKRAEKLATGQVVASAVCSDSADHFNPFNIDRKSSPETGNGTFDQYEIGDLSGKYGILDQDNYNVVFVDPFITLYGRMTVAGRSVVIHRNDSSRWTCANLGYNGPVVTAVATFNYPIVGRIIFRQELDDPLSATSVFIQSLTFSDGTKEDLQAEGHRWSVHNNAVNNDFYGWQNRCLSANEEFNPRSVNKDSSSGYKTDCSAANSVRCAVGDVTPRSGKLQLSLKTANRVKSRRFYNDENLPLLGSDAIIGKSLVVFHDGAPDFRGNRLACTMVLRSYPFQARVKRWYASGSQANVTGGVTFYQETEFDSTHVAVDITGLQKIASGYHVHEVSVPINLEFPCSADAVYGHFNPFAIDIKTSPPAGTGSQDQYEVGDMSGKYGTMALAEDFEKHVNDVNLPMQGPLSILGRSVVIHKADQGHRWVCGDIEPDIDVEGAQYIQAIASFHYPGGFAEGYIRLSQVVYSDGGMSDTVIEVKLKHPGRNDRNITSGHNWGVYVNQVGQDAAVKASIARCIGSGYAYNPFLTKKDDEDLPYKDECKPENPLRCEMGDLSGRLGALTIGGERKVFIDSNLPLAGNYSVLDKSIVIHDKNGGVDKFACANIKRDVDIVENLRIQKSKKFSGQAFIESVRETLAIPEWYLYLDASETEDMENCVQVTVHFRGPDANQLQYNFNILMNTGRVEKLYAAAPGTIKPNAEFHYRECRADRGLPSDATNWLYASETLLLISLLLNAMTY